VGDFDPVALAPGESTVRYHPDVFEILTESRYPGPGQSLVGSLTGAVAS
jgi:hypothetical protein